MNKQITVWLIIAAALILIGCIIFGGVMMAMRRNFNALSTNRYVTSTHGLTEPFKSISITSSTSDIIFVPSEDGTSSVICHESDTQRHSVTVQDGTLSISLVDTRKWYQYIGFNFNTSKITVSLPQGEYGTLLIKSDTGDITLPKNFKFEQIDISESTGDITGHATASGDIKIKASTGNINIEGAAANTMTLTVSTGKITVSDTVCAGDITLSSSTGKVALTGLRCANLSSDGSTGRINLKDVVASGKITVKRDTGDVHFEASDAAEIFVKTDTGDVTGSLLSDKIFFAETDTGHVDVPKTITGGRCEITTDTGDIKLKIGK